MSNRREFIKNMAAGGAVITGLACGGGGAKQGTGDTGGGPPPPPPPPTAPPAPILVIVTAEGGMDLLDALVPIGGANAGAYQSHRPSLKVNPANTTDIGSNLGLNKAFAGMASLHQQGRVAWLPGIGMPNPTLSHFLAADLWSQGSAVPGGTGWLGRYADLAFLSGGDPLRGISTDGLPLSVQGLDRNFVNISTPDTYRFPATRSEWGSVDDPAPLRVGFSDGFSMSGTPVSSGLKAAVESGHLYDQAQALFSSLIGTTRRASSVPYPGDAAYPDATLRDGYYHLSSQLKFIAEMIAKDLPSQVFVSSTGGFDTHSNHARDFPLLLNEMGASLNAFYADLASISTAKGNAQDRVIIMGWSEFGRRVRENNGGLDHGTAGLSYVIGKSVKGGLYSNYPDLANLDDNGNLKFTTDFRNLYATLLDKWMGVSSRTVLGGSYPNLGFL